MKAGWSKAKDFVAKGGEILKAGSFVTMQKKRKGKWEKQGVVFVADGAVPWGKSHAMVPTPYVVSDERIR